ncbi:MAG TPA: hypothetical protein PKH75_04095, partial [Bacillota bacterium]|nr:hypothetical protein [Bacillota bacterium]
SDRGLHFIRPHHQWCGHFLCLPGVFCEPMVSSNEREDNPKARASPKAAGSEGSFKGEHGT